MRRKRDGGCRTEARGFGPPRRITLADKARPLVFPWAASTESKLSHFRIASPRSVLPSLLALKSSWYPTLLGTGFHTRHLSPVVARWRASDSHILVGEVCKQDQEPDQCKDES